MDPNSSYNNTAKIKVQSDEVLPSSSNDSNVIIPCSDGSSSSAGGVCIASVTNNIHHISRGPTQHGSVQQVVHPTKNTTNSNTTTNTHATSIASSNTKPIKVTNNKRYKKVLCELFNYKDDEIDLERNYNADDYNFTVDELNTITSNDIIKLFNVKLFDLVQPKYPDLDRAFHTNHITTNTLHYYIKAIDFYTNYRNCSNNNNYHNNTYNESTNIGNPIHSLRVQQYIRWIDDVEHGRGYMYMDDGTMKFQYLTVISKSNIIQVPPYTVITTPIKTTKSSPSIPKVATTTTTPPPPPTTTTTQAIPTTTTTAKLTAATTTVSLKHNTDSMKRQKVHHDNVVVPAGTINKNTHNNKNNIITTTINNTNSSSNNNNTFNINNNSTTSTTTTTTNNNTQTTAAITTNNNNNTTTNTKPVKVNKTYQKLLRELFIFKKDENNEYRNYNDDHVFTIDELNTITSNDVITLLNVKFFNDIEPIRPDFYHAFQIKRRRLSTIYYYIKAIASFVQYRNTNNNTYNEYTNIGNPIHSIKVKKYIQWIDDQLNGRAYKYNHDGTIKSEYLSSFNEIGSNLPIQLPSSPQPNFVVPVVTPTITKSTITTTEVTSSTTIPITDDTPATATAAATTTTMESLNQMNESIQQLRDTIENSHTAIQLQINTLNDTIQQQYQQMMKLIQQQQNQLLVQQQQQQQQHGKQPPSPQSPNPTK